MELGKAGAPCVRACVCVGRVHVCANTHGQTMSRGAEILLASSVLATLHTAGPHRWKYCDSRGGFTAAGVEGRVLTMVQVAVFLDIS